MNKHRRILTWSDIVFMLCFGFAWSLLSNVLGFHSTNFQAVVLGFLGIILYDIRFPH